MPKKETTEAGSKSHEFLKFYEELYSAIYNRPALIDWIKATVVLRKMFQNSVVTMDLAMACLSAYFELEDQFLEERDYPPELFPNNIARCRVVVERDFSYYERKYKMSRDDYYKKYIEDIMKKYNLNVDEGGDQQQNK